MNRLYKYLGVVVFFFVGMNCKAVALNINADTATQNKLILANDSGFITKNEGLFFLLNEDDILYANELEPTPDDLYWQNFNQTDTIGKYYKKGNSNHYIMCLIDPASWDEPSFEEYIIIETNAKGELLKSENFPSRWRCWSDNDNTYAYDGFSKYGDFWGFEVCIGGQGWSLTNLYLFKEIIPRDSINPISIYGWLDHAAAEFDFYQVFKVSSMEIKENEVIIHYRKNKTEFKYDKKGNFLYEKIIENNKKITVKYTYNNGKWETKDKNKLKKIFLLNLSIEAKKDKKKMKEDNG